MIAAHHEEAAAKGVKIVNCCGFDSVPSDLGAQAVVEHIKQQHGRSAAQQVLDAYFRHSSTMTCTPCGCSHERLEQVFSQGGSPSLPVMLGSSKCPAGGKKSSTQAEMR